MLEPKASSDASDYSAIVYDALDVSSRELDCPSDCMEFRGRNCLKVTQEGA